MDVKIIRFIDSEYRSLFFLPDGGSIKIIYPTGDSRGALTQRCEHMDECHVKIGNNVYHVCEFAEKMEAIGARYEPENQLENAEIAIAPFGESDMFYRGKGDPRFIGMYGGDFGNGPAPDRGEKKNSPQGKAKRPLTKAKDKGR